MHRWNDASHIIRRIIMEAYLKGDPHPKTAKVEGNIVTIKHVTEFNNGEKMYMTTKVDLSNETPSAIKINAAYNYLIQVLRPRAIKVVKPKDFDETKAYKPSDYPAGKGGGISAFEQRKQAFMEVGFEEKEAELMAAGNQDAIEKAHATIIRRRNGKDTIVKNV